MLNKTVRLVIATVLAISLTACASGNGKKTDTTTATTSGSQTITNEAGTSATVKPTETTAAENTAGSTQSQTETSLQNSNATNGSKELMQSTKADLDADGKDEEIKVYKVVNKSSDKEVNEIEGLLEIKSSTINKEIVYIKKDEGLTGVISGLEVKDLDSDGSDDIFITIPESGAAFSINYYFMYSAKKDRAYSYTSDSFLNSFAGGFTFTYKGKGILEIANSNYMFKADINLVSKMKGIEADSSSNSDYEYSWVEPVPVVINEDSKLAIVQGSGGKPEIKVPLPVFGQATADMIGEVDIFYTVDSNFIPQIYRFEVLDFTDTGFVKAGEAKVF